MERNSNPHGPGWEPYPLSMRIREWIEWLHENAGVEGEVRDALVGSIAQQCAALAAQIEYHLMGNHLLENGITLCWAGLSLEGAEAAGWVEQGLKILREELKRQVLGDGAHDERSPMYQALIAEALLRLAGVAGGSKNRHGKAVQKAALGAGEAMMASLGCLVHPDGDYALLNDCALRIAPQYAALRRRFWEKDRSWFVVLRWSITSRQVEHGNYRRPAILAGGIGKALILFSMPGPLVPITSRATGTQTPSPLS